MLRCRLPKTTVVPLVLLSFVVVLFLGWYNPFIAQDAPPSQGKVHVLLLSSWRSGSSFLGQVFSQHPSVFYLMEPAWHVWMTLKRPGARSLRMAVRDLVRSIFQCDMSVMDAYLPPQHNVSHLFMWSHSRALCSPPACPLTPRGDISKEPECKRRCDSVGLQGAQRACNTYSHVVLKEVRFFELESLYPLLQDPTLDLRIIHLVRDPRAVLRSREQAAMALGLDSALVLEHNGELPADSQMQVMREVCRSHIRIHETAMQKAPDFLQRRYKLLRYEDLVRNPLAEIDAVYEFVGLDMVENLQEWIYRITHGKGKGSLNEAFKITSRNAEDVSLAWRMTLPFEKVKKIQQICKGAMSLLGYQMVHSKEEQQQLDVDLTAGHQNYEFSWIASKNTQSSKL